MKETSLLHKAEKIISGRRVLIAFYNETKQDDVLNYSHNIRIVVASVQSLEVLAFQHVGQKITGITFAGMD